MSATLHLARFSARQVIPMLGAMRHERAALDAMPELGAWRLFMLGTIDSASGGVPVPTRWGLLCGWNSDAARDEFFENGEVAARFTERAKESWSLALETVTVVTGDWRGWRPSTDGAAAFRSDEPLIAMTHARVKARYIPAFTRRNRKIARELDSDPGEVVRLALVDHPFTRSTISLWRSKGAMVRFAYGKGHHDPAQRRSREVPWITDEFFARFRPVRSSGTWGGVDPLDALLAGRQPLGEPA